MISLVIHLLGILEEWTIGQQNPKQGSPVGVCCSSSGDSGLGRAGEKWLILIYSEHRLVGFPAGLAVGMREGEEPWTTLRILAFTADRMGLPFPERER